jgi:hypothetical protein
VQLNRAPGFNPGAGLWPMVGPMGAPEHPAPPKPESRPWLGIHFVCAGAYQRVHRNEAGTAYTARCPKCAKCIRFKVGPGGDNRRFFEVSC